MPYRSVTHIENAVTNTAGGPNAAFTSLITLPNPTWEGRTTHAIRIGGGALPRIGVYVVGGLHAREWGSADLLARLIEDLTQSYRLNNALAFGGRTFTAAEVRRVVEGLNLYVFPQANPDGRHYSMSSVAMWRKNRRPDADPAKVGVDVNRNFDFCWHYPTFFAAGAGVASSTDPTSSTYIGPSVESEPETRNIVSILDGHSEIRFFVDVHSYSQLILYGWGDDEMQTTTPSENFANPAWNGQRGIGGDAYGEWIPNPDRALEELLGNRMNSGIVAAGGPSYTVEPSFNLYPTSGTSTERAFKQWFLDRAKGKVHGYTVEWGTEFQPPWATMDQIADQVCAGLMEFFLGILDTYSDVYIRDNTSDTGTSTSNNPFWESPDIVIRNTDDGVFAHQEPIAGRDNFLYVRIHNRGPNATRELRVSARAAAFAGTEFLFPHDWTVVDATHVAPTPIVDSFDNVPPGSTRIARFRLSAAQVDQLSGWQGSGWHPCLLAEADCVTDYAATGGNRVWQNNNLAQRNVTVLPARAGTILDWPFLVGHELDESVFARLDIDLVDLPRKAVVELDLLDGDRRFPAFTDGRVVDVRTLVEAPVGVGVAREPVDVDGGDAVAVAVKPEVLGARVLSGGLGRLVMDVRGAEPSGDRLRLTRSRTSIDLTRVPHKLNQAVLRLTVPEGATVGEVYRVRVAQRDRKGRVVGGVTLEVPVVD